ncbi:hypothetical protein CORC01_08591 [Colletotrichum orchidophilum]|uniref:Uncharacterized protein n=1 Tax=Colletotrichum orchidophilum TaxID=1209926 RepID=A0A1G4B3U1_9PEZI|nr:uncharacterized protein CORC01_08591 [Colletotrichum orchidophilum]OHE96054.1 hypothetical protein CORC01_08591 [Colletotrichum orchidophilum]
MSASRFTLAAVSTPSVLYVVGGLEVQPMTLDGSARGSSMLEPPALKVRLAAAPVALTASDYTAVQDWLSSLLHVSHSLRPDLSYHTRTSKKCDDYF